MTARTPANHPSGMTALLNAFLDWLNVHNYSEATVSNRRVYLTAFIAWAGQRGIDKPQEVLKPVLERYQAFLHRFRKPDGKPLAVRSQAAHIAALRAWFRWLTRENFIAANPASELVPPRREFRLPGHVLSPLQVERILAQPDVTNAVGLRDRAILETLYSTGIRRFELIRLTPTDVDHERGLLLIRLGKGKKDRIIPIGTRAVAWIDRYVEEARPKLLPEDDGEAALFVRDKGRPLSPNRLSEAVARYMEAAGIENRGACHLLRHAMATAMLENGADVRMVQAMLGHSNLQTTAVYTHVAVLKLKQIHEATHPARQAASEADAEKKGRALRERDG